MAMDDRVNDVSNALDRIDDNLDRLNDTMDRLSDRLGVIANAVLQLADKHGSSTPGPYR